MSITKRKAAAGGGGTAGKDGRGIVSSVIDENGYLIITYTDGVVENTGMVVGENGDSGQNGRGIASSIITDGNLIITYSDGTSENLGKVAGKSGAPGTSTIIKGNVNSDTAITAINNPQPGDSYIASGTWFSMLYPQLNIEHPNTAGVDVDFGDLIVWNGDAWQNVGNIQGPKGEPGDVGNTGIGVASVAVNPENHLIVTYTNGSTQDAGLIKGSSDISLRLRGRFYYVSVTTNEETSEYSAPPILRLNYEGGSNILDGELSADTINALHSMKANSAANGGISPDRFSKNGFYSVYLFSGNPYYPIKNNSTGLLLNSVYSSYLQTQVLFAENKSFFRKRNDTAWSNWVEIGAGQTTGSGSGSGFETHHIMSAQTDALRLANNGDAQLIRASPTGQATIKSLSIMYGQISNGQYELAIMDKNGVVLGKTGLQNFSTPLGLKTHPIDVDVNVSPSNIYYLGIRVTQPNTDLHLAGNTINIADNTIKNVVPASYYRSNGNEWQGVNVNVISGQNFIPWIKANAV